MYKVRDKYPVGESILLAVGVFFVFFSEQHFDLDEDQKTLCLHLILLALRPQLFFIFLLVFPILNDDVDGTETVTFQQTFTLIDSKGVTVWHAVANKNYTPCGQFILSNSCKFYRCALSKIYKSALPVQDVSSQLGFVTQPNLFK